jgi:hypothetical protein
MALAFLSYYDRVRYGRRCSTARAGTISIEAGAYCDLITLTFPLNELCSHQWPNLGNGVPHQVARTVASESVVEEEIRYLISVLGA